MYYRSAIRMPTQTTVWWSKSREDSDSVVAQYLSDAALLTARGEHQWAEVTQEQYAEGSTVCALLNGIAEFRPLLRVRIEAGMVSEYARANQRTDLVDIGRVEPVDGSTPEYRRWYSWLLGQPALYHLCAAAFQMRVWKRALVHADVQIPRHIVHWLYNTVHGAKSARNGTTNGSA